MTIHVTQEKITGTQGTLLLGVMQAYAAAYEQLGDRLPDDGRDD